MAAPESVPERFLESPPPADDSADMALVTIQRFRDLPPALLARSKLESFRIDCFLADENMVRVNWCYSNVIGGIRLQVRVRDVQIASEILEAPRYVDMFPLAFLWFAWMFLNQLAVFLVMVLR